MLVTYVPFNTNKLSRVIDATANAAGFPGMSTAQSYGYDSNGRLVQDPQEGLAIDWLPFDKTWKVTKANGSVFEYGYDALHNRVEKITLSNNERSAYIRDASGNIVALYEYKNGLWFWREQHLYGIDRVGVEKIVSEVIVTQVPIYVDCPPATPAPCIVGDTYVNTIQYQYTGTKYYELTNHLGNVMVVITDQVSAVGTLVLPTVVSATDYFPFGMEMTGRTFSSDAYSFGFNTQIESPEIAPGHTTAMYWEYDSRIGRRWERDPLSQMVPFHSPYSVMSGNPILFSDILGNLDDGWVGQMGSDGLIHYTWDENVNTLDEALKSGKYDNAVDFKEAGHSYPNYYDMSQTVHLGVGTWSLSSPALDKLPSFEIKQLEWNRNGGGLTHGYSLTPPQVGTDKKPKFNYIDWVIGVADDIADNTEPFFASASLYATKKVNQRLKYHSFEKGRFQHSIKTLPNIRTPLGSVKVPTAFKIAKSLKVVGRVFAIISYANYANDFHNGKEEKAVAGMLITTASLIGTALCPACALAIVGGTAFYNLVLEDMIFPEEQTQK